MENCDEELLVESLSSFRVDQGPCAGGLVPKFRKRAFERQVKHLMNIWSCVVKLWGGEEPKEMSSDVIVFPI